MADDGADQAAVETERRSARMAAIAGLARPVQHDINNLLTVVFANLEMLKRTAAAGGPQRQLDRIQEAARRFEGTTRSLLAMLRRPPAPPGPLRLSEAIGAIQPLLALLMPAPGALTLELAAEDPPVALDRTALEEALFALAEEAAEALRRGGGLRLTVQADADAAELVLEWPEGLQLASLAQLRVVLGPGSGDERGWRCRLPRVVEPT